VESKFRVHGKVYGVGFRVYGLRCGEGFGFRVEYLGFSVWGLGFWVLVSGFGV